MKDTNRYNEILNLLDMDSSNEYTSSQEPKKVTFNSEKNKQRYFQLINISQKDQENFPETFEIIASNNIVITPENPLIIEENKDPVAYHFNTMTFKNGGQILCNASALITVEILTKQ